MQNKTIQTTWIPVAQIEKNDGQIQGLPANPRVIRDDKFKKLCNSIKENPEMLSLRELLVYPVGDKYIIIGGNQRFAAMTAIGYTEAPCKVIPAETPVQALKAYTIKDNNGFGEWDWDMLANEWDSKELDDWGLDVWQNQDESQHAPDEFGDDFSLESGERGNTRQMTFTLTTEQQGVIEQALDIAIHNQEEAETFGNTNKNGNAIYKIVKQWVEQKK